MSDCLIETNLFLIYPNIFWSLLQQFSLYLMLIHQHFFNEDVQYVVEYTSLWTKIQDEKKVINTWGFKVMGIGKNTQGEYIKWY